MPEINEEKHAAAAKEAAEIFDGLDRALTEYHRRLAHLVDQKERALFLLTNLHAEGFVRRTEGTEGNLASSVDPE